jgi:prepilin-type N-terminal cleavage/methylation domain-containing protein
MKKSQGFTLIELMVVIVIIGILAAIAIPKFMDAQTKAKFGEVPVIMASYDHAQLAYLAETASIAGSETNLILDPTTSKWFTYGYNLSGSDGVYSASKLPNIALGTITSTAAGANSTVTPQGGITHATDNTVGYTKYLPNFR